MKRVLFAAIITALVFSPAMAQETCASKAIGKNGKPLAGAALNSFFEKMQAGGMHAEGGERRG